MSSGLPEKAKEASRKIAEGTRNTVRGIIRLVKWTLALAVIISGLAGWFYYTANYSEGTRSGRLIKISKKGVVFKTWEGQLDVGGISATGAAGAGGVTSLWEFTVPADKPALALQLDGLSGRHVKVHYHEKYRVFFWRGNTKYFVTRVEELKRQAR